MMRPGTAVKRNFKVAAPKVQHATEDLKLPEASHFLKKRDFMAALTLLECDRKYSRRHDIKTYLGIAYCAYHNGDYSRSIQIYDELLKKGEDNQEGLSNIYVFKACCMYALCQYKEAKVECEKAIEESPLKMRLLF